MLWNVLIVKLGKLYTVNLYVFLSALYMLQYVPIVTILVNCIFFQKKKEKKNDPYFGMGKNTKVMPQYPAIYLFLGKGRESLHLKALHKNYVQVHFLPCPWHKKDSDKTWTMHVKIAQNMYIFSCEFRTFPVTEGNEI